ncbi:MAG: hypothetical protein ACOVO2_10775 [Emticicia sp.]|uniref:hypothetical protein n=1 Tax=Emticicia sp. TaxID=1930953 RepID=UPI003BA54C10
MKQRVILLLIFNCLIISVMAQKTTERYLEDQYSWYVSLSLGNPTGNYHKILKEADNAGTKAGIVIGGLMNPYKRKKASTVFYGFEAGFQSNGRDKDFVSNALGEFYVANYSFWLNGVARYRPILWSSKINPYADAFFGPKIIRTAVVEQFGQDETEILKAVNKLVPNYGAGVGLGIKLSGQLKNSYLDIGLYYQQADATRIVKPNSVEINSSYLTSFKQVLTSTNQIVVKIGLTGFL